MVAGHSVFLITLQDHSASLSKAQEDWLLENISCYPPFPFLSHFHTLWSSHAVILCLISVVYLQPSFMRMLVLGRKVEAELATKRVLMTNAFGHSPEVSFSFIYVLFHRTLLLS